MGAHRLPYRCWIADHDPWGDPHYRTPQQARAIERHELNEDGEVDAPLPPIRPADRFCWTLLCDGCGIDPYDEDDDEGPGMHHDDPLAARRHARRLGWSTTVLGDRCPACQRRPHPLPLAAA